MEVSDKEKLGSIRRKKHTNKAQTIHYKHING